MITQEELKHLLIYDSETGGFKWKRKGYRYRNLPMRKAGNERLCNTSGKSYLWIQINRKSYPGHVLSWLYNYGSYPNFSIDHINGNGLDNRIDNLRDVTHADNMKNKRIYKTNVSGVAGVRYISVHKKWLVDISSEGERIYLGIFDSLLDAVCVRKQAEKNFGFHSNHGLERAL